MKVILLASLLLAFFNPVPVYAIFSCEGTLKKENFADETTKAQNDLQKKILEYRKLESTGGGTAESKEQLAKIMAEIEVYKKTYKDLTSKYFPSTPVTAFGAACQDKRWLEQAKAVLVEKPELLGKQWFVWLDKTTRKPQASNNRPAANLMAE